MLLVAVEEPPGILWKVGRVDRGVADGGVDDPVEDGVEEPVLAAEVVVDLRLVGLAARRYGRPARRRYRERRTPLRRRRAGAAALLPRLGPSAQPSGLTVQLTTGSGRASLELTNCLERKALVSQVWLVTGSSRGLGRHVVEAALERGDRVLATARRPEALEDLVAAHGDRLRTIAHDVAVRRPGGRRCAGGARGVRSARRRRQQRRLRRPRLGRGHERGGVPRSDRGRLLRHGAHHQGGSANPARAGRAGTSST